MQQPHQRVGVFVDVQNMYYSARALFEQKVDFGEILKEAVGDRQLIRAFAYVIAAENEDEGSFFEALQERGYELRTKQLLNFYGGNSKGDWDVGIAMDVVRMLPKLDVVVLVSGDGDFAELLKYAKSRGVRAEVMAFGSSASSQLREEAEALFDLSQDPHRFLIPKKTQPIKKKPRTLESQALIQLEQGSVAKPVSTNAQPRQRGASGQQRSAQPPQRDTKEPRAYHAGAKPFQLPGSGAAAARNRNTSRGPARGEQRGEQRAPQQQPRQASTTSSAPRAPRRSDAAPRSGASSQPRAPRPRP